MLKNFEHLGFPHRGQATRKSIRRLVLAVSVSFVSLLIGALGYTFIEQYSLMDGLYMAVITLSTVGFSEVRPLSTGGRIFTTLYIISNLVIFAYVVSVFTTYVFEGELKYIFKKFMIGREVQKLKNHVIVCGYGRNGRKACEELAASGRDFVVVEHDQDKVANFPERKHYFLVLGDGTLDETLKNAGVEKAETIITTLPADANNVFICLTAKELNPEINVIARASEENSEKKLYRAGAGHVVKPDNLGGVYMAQLITKPEVIEFLELLNGTGEVNLSLEKFSFEKLKDEYKHMTIRDLDIRKHTGVNIIGIKDPEKGFIFSPDVNEVLKEGAILIVVGSNPNLEKFQEYFFQ